MCYMSSVNIEQTTAHVPPEATEPQSGARKSESERERERERGKTEQDTREMRQREREGEEWNAACVTIATTHSAAFLVFATIRNRRNLWGRVLHLC